MRRAALTAGLAVAAFLAWHGFGLAAVLLYVWASAMVSSAGTAKSRATEDRVAALENQTAANSTTLTATTTAANTAQTTANTTNTRVGSLSGAQTANPNITGATSNTSDVQVSGNVL